MATLLSRGGRGPAWGVPREADVQVLQIRNAWSFLKLCRGPIERAAMLRWLLGLAWSRACRRSGPAVTTLSIQGLRFTLDWAAAEHVSIREILDRGEYWTRPAFRPAPGQVVVDVGANAGVFATVAGIDRARRAPGRDRAESKRHRTTAPEPASERPRATIGGDRRGSADRAGRGRLVVGRIRQIGSVALDGGAGPGIEIELRTLDDVALP